MNMTPTEGEEQATLFHWCDMVKGKYPELQLLFHIPNGGERRKSEAARMKAEGVKPGVPDLFLPVARGGYHGLFIEMKRREGGRISKEQKVWQAELLRQGYCACVCRGWEEAQHQIVAYLNGDTEWMF